MDQTNIFQVPQHVFALWGIFVQLHLVSCVSDFKGMVRNRRMTRTLLPLPAIILPSGATVGKGKDRKARQGAHAQSERGTEQILAIVLPRCRPHCQLIRLGPVAPLITKLEPAEQTAR